LFDGFSVFVEYQMLRQVGTTALRNIVRGKMSKLARVFAVFFVSLLTTFSAGAAQLIAKVDVSRQVMTISYQGEILHTWPVSTGRSGFDTPRGAWKPKHMAQMWLSKKYDNAPMPYSVFFTGGYAVHGTSKVKALGRPASHGCVRLQTKNAAKFYSLVQQVGRKNTKIVITN
jgi:lipoprotein-anchoring transpeptidase ErfK/SrfK